MACRECDTHGYDFIRPSQVIFSTDSSVRLLRVPMVRVHQHKNRAIWVKGMKWNCLVVRETTSGCSQASQKLSLFSVWGEETKGSDKRHPVTMQRHSPNPLVAWCWIARNAFPRWGTSNAQRRRRGLRCSHAVTAMKKHNAGRRVTMRVGVSDGQTIRQFWGVTGGWTNAMLRIRLLLKWRHEWMSALLF